MRPTGRLRVLDWNLNAFTSDRCSDKLDLLERLDWDVATLQELMPGSIKQVRQRFPEPEHKLVTPAPSDAWRRPGSRRRTGVLIRPSVRFVVERQIDCGEQHPPGRTPDVPGEALAAADIEVDNVTVSVISAHPPHSAGRRSEHTWRLRGKLGVYDALAQWVSGRPRVVVGIDANWWIDRSPFVLPSWDDTDEQSPIYRFFFDPNQVHGLHDAFRMWLDLHPQALMEIRKVRPNGPLAVTHLRGRTVPIPDRFDVVMVSSSIAVNDIQHNYDDAVAAGSDHAYVLADLSVSA